MDVSSASLLEIPPELAYVFSKLDGKMDFMVFVIRLVLTLLSLYLLTWSCH